jgi:hypothetical protein
MPRIKAISSTASKRKSGCGTPFAAVGLLVAIAFGSAIGYFLTFRPLYGLIEAQSWTPTTCIVVSSRVDEGDGTGRADIVYRYEFGDRQYTADRYDFIPGKTASGNVPIAVADHPPGKRFTCYVDPADPSRAVINRSHSLWYHIGTPFFFVFAGVPFVIAIFMLQERRNQRRAEQALLAGAPSQGTGDPRFGSPATPSLAGPVVLKPDASPIGKVIGFGLICAFWNGIVGVFTVLEFWLYSKGDSAFWFVALFMLIFQGIGVMILVGFVNQILALFNPRPMLTLGRATIPLGGTVSFGWQLTGKAHRVTHLKITLKGEEEARYRRGTDSHTDTHVFFTASLADVSHTGGIARGSGTIRVPADTMHTFTADNNKVKWTIEVAGEIPRWSDVDDTFEIEVEPA